MAEFAKNFTISRSTSPKRSLQLCWERPRNTRSTRKSVGIDGLVALSQKRQNFGQPPAYATKRGSLGDFRQATRLLDLGATCRLTSYRLASAPLRERAVPCPTWIFRSLLFGLTACRWPLASIKLPNSQPVSVVSTFNPLGCRKWEICS